MKTSDIHEFSATEIVGLIKSKLLSSYEVASAFIAHNQKFPNFLNAWSAIDFSYILEQATELDKKKTGALLGVPVGVKDIFNTLFYPTQKGAFYWQGYKAGNDARCVSYLRNEDALIFGKTDTAELAVHAHGKAINPYNAAHVTGSSSSGSAVAVSTAMVPVALGSQTAGSLIRPASWCGVYAMKPSFGLISRTGVLKTTDTLDSMGFFTRGLDDLELFLNVMRVKGSNFPIQEKKIKHYQDSIKKKWRVAFCTGHTWEVTQDAVKNALRTFKEHLKSSENIEVLELSLPKETHTCHPLHKRIYHSCLSYYLKKEYETYPENISDSLKNIMEEAKSIPPADYQIALKEQAALAQVLEVFFLENNLDAIIVNSSNGAAPTQEPEFHQDLNMLWTMAWLPVINIPAFSDANHLPFGVSVIGPRYSDYKILALLNHLKNQQIIPNKSPIPKTKSPNYESVPC